MRSFSAWNIGYPSSHFDQFNLQSINCKYNMYFQSILGTSLHCIKLQYLKLHWFTLPTPLTLCLCDTVVFIQHPVKIKTWIRCNFRNFVALYKITVFKTALIYLTYSTYIVFVRHGCIHPASCENKNLNSMQILESKSLVSFLPETIKRGSLKSSKQ